MSMRTAKVRKFRKSELTVSNDSDSRGRNYLGVLMSILVLSVISSTIVAAIVIISPDIVSLSGKNLAPRQGITLEEALFNELSANSFPFKWLDPKSDQSTRRDGDELAHDELLCEDQKNINIVAIKEQKQEVRLSKQALSSPRFSANFAPKVELLISNTSLISSIEFQGYKLSPSKRFMLIWTSKKKQFRYTSTAKYFLYDIKSELISLLSMRATGGAGSYENLDAATQYLNEQDEGDELSRFQVAEWFSRRDNSGALKDSLLLVQNNDLFLLDDVEGHQAGRAGAELRRKWPTRLTFTGKQDEIFNGVPDWLYEEEILGSEPAFKLSPTGSHLAYMSFNDSLVDFMAFSVYGSSEQQIPRAKRIRYPKAGRVNPSVSVHVVDIWASSQQGAAQSTSRLQLPEDLAQQQHYVNRIEWLTADKLALLWLNRAQNDSFVVICSRPADLQQQSWPCEKNMRLQAPGGWLELANDLYALDEHHYLLLMPKHEGDDVGSFKHVAKVSLSRPNNFTFVTSGRKEVTNIEGVSQRSQLLFYTSSVVGEPGQRQLFAASLDASWQGDDACVTCAHYPEECLFNSVKLSPSAEYYVFECDGPGIPRTELRRMPTAAALSLGRRQTTSSRVAAAAQKSLPKSKPNGAADDDSAKSEPPAAESNASSPSPPPLAPFESLLWTIEENQALRDKLAYTKAMPLTVRLKVPIANTNYSADVLMLLPPQLGGAASSGGNSARSSSRQQRQPTAGRALMPAALYEAVNAGQPAPYLSRRRIARAALEQRASSQPNLAANPQLAPHLHLTPDSISEYTRHLASGQQYPMVVDVYGGPGSQKVDYRFYINLGHYLASSRRTIYVMIDGRGSGFQGTKRLFELRHKLGSVEIEDQIEVVAYLTRNYSFIDPSKVAIWGWSYGGYAAAMALAQSNAMALQARKKTLANNNLDQSNNNNNNNTNQLSAQSVRLNFANSSPIIPLRGVFECAVSVAPVTNWIYYDTAYTERYMSSPYLNERFDKTTPGDHRSNNSESAWMDNRRRESAEEEALAKWRPLNQTIDTFSSLRTTSSSILNNLMRASKPHSNSDINERYRKSSLIENIANIDRKRFLLIHGTADDNVHFQQSIMLMKSLIQKNVLYESRLYPDQDHAIADKANKLHLGSTLSNFFAECFDMAD